MRENPFSPGPGLAGRMAAQLGTFTAEQAYAAGHNHKEVQLLRAAKILHSVRRGVYALREPYLALGPMEKHRVDTQALLLSVAAPAALSHETAAVWSGLELLTPVLDLLHLTRPELQASRREAGVHHHPGSLPAGHVHEVGGVRQTTAARIAVDIARTRDFPAGLAAVDSARRSGATEEQVRNVLFYCASWPGARGASRAVACGDERSANPGESLSRAVLLDAGLEPSGLQVLVRDSQGFIGYGDFGWLPHRVIGEFDGRSKYGMAPDSPADALWREKRREDRLRALGFEVVRWTWADLLVPSKVPALVREALARATVRSMSIA
ncbi:MAG: hypothetical protein LH461_08070 [Spirochaetaceae bacterium]|nr:hypothetical protein [Spirochaetaceae bacterium]